MSSPSSEFSPFAVAQNLVEQLLTAELGPRDYAEAIERYIEHVSSWGDHLSALPLPESDNAEESRVLLEGSLRGVDLVVHGAEILSRLAETPSEEVAEEGLQTVLEGQQLMQQVQEISDQNITSAIDDARYMD